MHYICCKSIKGIFHNIVSRVTLDCTVLQKKWDTTQLYIYTFAIHTKKIYSKHEAYLSFYQVRIRYKIFIYFNKISSHATAAKEKACTQL